MFKFEVVPNNASEIAADGYDPRLLQLEVLRKHLMDAIKASSEEDYLAKYLWLAGHFNSAISEFNEHSIDKIEPITGVFNTCS